jgi:hypothetical protein
VEPSVEGIIMIAKRTVVALMFAVTASAPAAAQELLLGYQVQRFGSDGDSVTAPLGISVSVAGPHSRAARLVGQVDWSRKRESQTLLGTSFDATADFTAFAGGVRVGGVTRTGAEPFFDVLFGAMRSSGSARIAGQSVGSASETDPMFEVGGGMAVPVGGALGVFGQLAYRRVFADGTGVNGVRFVAGIRLASK